MDKPNRLKKGIYCQNDSSVSLPDASRNMNITICGYANLKNTIEEFQEGDEINQNLKKQKKNGIIIVHEKFKSQSKSNNNHSF